MTYGVTYGIISFYSLQTSTYWRRSIVLRMPSIATIVKMIARISIITATKPKIIWSRIKKNRTRGLCIHKYTLKYIYVLL